MGDRKKSRRARRNGNSGDPAQHPTVKLIAVEPGVPVVAGATTADAVVVPEAGPIVIHPPVQGDHRASLVDDSIRAEVRQALETPVVTPASPFAPPPPAPEPAPVDAVPQPRAAADGRRATSLDALRGLFLVLMTIGFTVRGDLFPQWMYHRQFPPPDFELTPIAGIAWRDLTYVAFLFTMAAALPITLSRRIAKGETEIGIMAGAVKRYLLLLVFALLIGHSNTYFVGYTQTARGVAIAGFVVMALAFTRPRPEWHPRVRALFGTAGWVAAIAFLAASPLLYGETFSFARVDEVISGLAFASLAGAVVWYFTRGNLAARLGVLAGAVALYLGSRGEGWVQSWWWSSPVSWAFSPSKLSLLTIVVPGTIAGDLLLRWTRGDDTATAGVPWSRTRIALVATLALAFAPVLTVGMYTREVLLTTQIVLALTAVGLFATARPATSLERTLRSLFLWGAAWTVLGLWMEPFEGGMKKVPETLSYFFAVTGVSVMLLAGLTAVVEALGRRRLLAPLVDVGQNPMLCYVLYTVLLNSLLELIPPLRGVLRGSAGEIALRMAIEVTAVVLIVRFFTRRRIFWRT